MLPKVRIKWGLCSVSPGLGLINKDVRKEPLLILGRWVREWGHLLDKEACLLLACLKSRLWRLDFIEWALTFSTPSALTLWKGHPNSYYCFYFDLVWNWEMCIMRSGHNSRLKSDDWIFISEKMLVININLLQLRKIQRRSVK